MLLLELLLLEVLLLSSLLLLEEEEEEESFLAAAAAAIICFGAFLRCSRRSSVRPPRPILVKKLMANLHICIYVYESDFLIRDCSTLLQGK